MGCQAFRARATKLKDGLGAEIGEPDLFIHQQVSSVCQYVMMN